MSKTIENYFDRLDQALDAAYARGIAAGAEFDPEETGRWLSTFTASGVSYGQTISHSLPVLKWKGKLSYTRALTCVIYRLESGRYELTAYCA